MFSFKSNYLILMGSLAMTALLFWFAVANYRSADPVAHSILRGLSLSLGQAVESVAMRDSSLKILSDFNSRDIAFFSVIDHSGRIRFHTNPELIGEQIQDSRYQAVADSPVVTEQRIRLGTGEVVFETQQQLHLPGGTMILRLALHTWQADQIIRRARTGVVVILLLLGTAWGMGLFALRLQQRDLRRREEMAQREYLVQLGALGAVLAHEVRTPLAGIKGYAQLLQERLNDLRLSRYAAMIITESRRLEELVNDLLTFARQEPMPKGQAVVEEEILKVWENLSLAVTKSGVVLQVSGEIKKPVACPADRLQQLLLNLFSNAIQALPDGGTVRVVLSDDDVKATLLVADSGSGFTGESLKRAFDPFYTTRASGSGLGLAVCRKIAEGYGGILAVANGCSGGAEITLRLPLLKEL